MSTTILFAARTKGSPVGQKMKGLSMITSVVFVLWLGVGGTDDEKSSRGEYG